MCPLNSNGQYVIIISNNGLASNRWQATVWTNDGLVHWCIYASLSLNALTIVAQTKPLLVHNWTEFGPI